MMPVSFSLLLRARAASFLCCSFCIPIRILLCLSLTPGDRGDLDLVLLSVRIGLRILDLDLVILSTLRVPGFLFLTLFLLLSWGFWYFLLLFLFLQYCLDFPSAHIHLFSIHNFLSL